MQKKVFLKNAVSFLDSMGFEGFESMSLDILYYACITIFYNMCKSINTLSQLIERQFPHTTDFYNLCKIHQVSIRELEGILRISRSINFSEEECCIMEEKAAEETTMVRLSSPDNAFTDYKGLPLLPSTHTYRSTPVQVKKNAVPGRFIIQMSSEKDRIEKNLRKMLKSSGLGPHFVKYECC